MCSTKKKNKIQVSKDHLTKYFQAIEETIRTFPPTLQIHVKSKISGIIHKAELQNISLPISSTYSQFHEPNVRRQQTPPAQPSQTTNIHELQPYRPNISEEYSAQTYPMSQQSPNTLTTSVANKRAAYSISQRNVQYSPSEGFNQFPPEEEVYEQIDNRK